MLHPPGKCRACGAVFPATAFSASNSTGITFRGCSTNCPICGGHADILDGTYDFIGDTIRLLSGPQSTADVLLQLARAVRNSVAAGESAEKTVDRITEIAPWLEGLKKFAKGQVVNLVWCALGAIAGYEYTQYRDSLTAADKREQQVLVVQDAIQRDREAQQWQEFQARMNEPLLEPPPVPTTQRYRFIPNDGPLIREAPHTMEKLSQYMKQNKQRYK